MRRYPCLAVAILLCVGSAVTSAQTLQPYMAPIAGKTAATPSEISSPIEENLVVATMLIISGFWCQSRPNVLQLRHMSKTVTIRLTKELAIWLEQASKQSGVPKGRIVREQLEKAREGGKEPSFMRLAGSVRGVRDLSTRKGFSRS